MELPTALTGSRVTVGNTAEGERVVVLAHGVAEIDDSLWAIDAPTTEVRQLPDLPFDGWVTAAQVTSTERFVLLVATACSRPPVAGDAGYECDGEATTRLAVHDAVHRRWSSVPSPVEALGDVLAMSGGTATLVADTWNADGTPAHLVWSMDLLTMAQSEPRPIQKPAQCLHEGSPAVRVEGPPGSQQAVLDSAAGELRFPLPVAVESLSTGETGPLMCYSSGPFLAIPGRPPAPTASRYSPSHEASANPTSTTWGRNPDPRLTVFDLRHPDASPTKVGDTDSLMAFVSGTDFWAIEDAEGIHLFRSSDGASEHAGTFEHPGGNPGGLIATDASLLAFTRGPGGSLAALHRLDF